MVVDLKKKKKLEMVMFGVEGDGGRIEGVMAKDGDALESLSKLAGRLVWRWPRC